jgi:hypothetical protein
MRLTNANGDEFELRVAGYQFPGTDDEEPYHRYDLNWLDITLHARSSQGAWDATRPCLLTWELGWLVEWFEQIHAHQPVDEALIFLEPDLQFRLISDHPPTVRVVLGWGFRPPWLPAFPGKITLDFGLALDSLAAVISDLKTYQEHFPRRETT